MEHSVSAGLVLVSTDEDLVIIGQRWLTQARAFRLITWEQGPHQRVRPAPFVAAFEDLARRPDPFAYPIVYLQPKR